MADIRILAADRDIESTITELFSTRCSDLEIRQVEFEVRTHESHDAGCRTTAHNILRPFARTDKHCIVIFDKEGCGTEHLPREHIESEVENLLKINGWGEDRAACIVIDPEVESWIWAADSRVSEVLGWGSDFTVLSNWLVSKSLLAAGQLKPADPKTAYLQAISKSRIRRSPLRFKQLASMVDFRHCTDPAFHKLITTLQGWFGENA